MDSKKPINPPNQPVVSRVARRTFKKTEKKRLKKERIKNLPKWRKVLRVFRKTVSTIVILGVLTTGIGVSVVWYQYGDTIKSSVTEGFAIADEIKVEDFIQRQPTVVYDRNGNIIKEFKQYEYDAPTYEEINPYFLEGIVAVEDKRFYLHHGVDVYGTIRSVASTVLGGGVQGGSTITQQLVRNVILNNNEVSIDRKLKEQVVAQELEKKFSKEEILRQYLNNVYFGHGNYGIGTASNYYFGKDQSELTADEVAVIIGITNNPSIFDPINNPDNALSKRNRLLNTFLNAGIITPQEHDEMVQKPIELNIQKQNIDNRVSGNYALSFAVHEATEDLMEVNGFVFQYVFDTTEEYKAYQERYQEAYDKHRQNIVMGGYEIYTSIDPNVQEKLERVVETEMRGYSDKTQLAITTVDNETGEVIALVGGRDSSEYFNRAYQGVRQPGSVAKPLVAYANAFELGYTPQSQVADREIKNGPKNWYSGYRGNMSIRYALEQSVNTVAYRLATTTGSDVFLDKLARMEFSHLAPEDANPIIAIGGFTNGVTTVEMAGGYATLTRDGNFLEPTNIREIKDIVTGESLYKNEFEETKVFQEDAAYFMIDSLKSVMRYGTGKSAQLSNYPHVFGKTGTTNGNRDSYFSGGTPYYTTAVWVGHDTPAALTNDELNLTQELFREWNEELHEGKKHVDFEMPKSVYRSGKELFTKLETYAKLQATREANEEIRLDKERKAQRERLALEDYRIVYGLTSEEEKEREALTEEAIQKAQNFVMVEVEDYEKWMELIEEAKERNKVVKHQAANDAYTARINELEVLASTEKKRLIEEIERQFKEQQRLEEERVREKVLIQSMQQELNTWMKRIENGEALSEGEFRQLEELVVKLENKGVVVPDIQIEWIEPEKEEERFPNQGTQKPTPNETTPPTKKETTDNKEQSQGETPEVPNESESNAVEENSTSN